MPDMEKVALLKRMLAQIAPQKQVRNLITEGLERPAGLEAAGPPQPAVPALEKLSEGQDADLTAHEVSALEAIVLPRNRPVVFIRNGSYEDIEDPWTHLNATVVRNRISPLLASIGRIELPNQSWIPYGGTGFVVGNGILMTNRHVAKLFCDGLGTRTLRYTPGSAAIDFLREVDAPADDGSMLQVIEVLMVHPYWDMALLRCTGLERHRPLRLSVTDPAEQLDQDVVVVGYPARDDRNDLALQDQIFQRTYNVKRLQPGKLRSRDRILSFETTVNAATHDSSTLGGNSGSAVIDVVTGKVIGLHFAGLYLKANYAVPTFELARDPRVVRLGLNFDGSVPATTEFDRAWQSADGAEAAVTVGRDEPEPALAPPQGANGAGSAAVRAAAGSLTIPLEVTVSVALAKPGPAAGGGAGAALAAAMVEEGLKIPTIFDGLESRAGYRADFLDLDRNEEVPLPALTSKGKKIVATTEDGEWELKYHKFSVVVHKVRRLALFTAANVDWRPASRLINGKKPTRKQLTGLKDGDIEQWVTDWRLPAQHQLPDAFYTKDGGAFDKGHLVRRDDVAWGASLKDMQKGNGDTYHTTNCSPQVSSFNQSSRGEDNWGDLENLVAQQTTTESAIIFSGPVFREDDQLFDGKDGNGGRILLRIPRSFWKIVVVNDENGAGAYGFTLEQDLSAVPVAVEFAVPAPWKKYLKSVAEIEGLLGGLVKLTWLKQHDRFSTQEALAIAGDLR